MLEPNPVFVLQSEVASLVEQAAQIVAMVPLPALNENIDDDLRMAIIKMAKHQSWAGAMQIAGVLVGSCAAPCAESREQVWRIG